MIVALWFVLIAQSAPPVPAPAPAPAPAADAPVSSVAEAPTPPVAAWDRPFAEGLAEVRRLAESGSIDEAVAIAERLVAPNAIARMIEDLVRAEGWKARAGRALESVGDALDLSGPPPAVRAEAQHARAVALRLGLERAQSEDERAVRREQSALAFESARLLAGPGALRLDATYEQGTLLLAAGEERRAKLPEISGQPAQPPPPPPPVSAGAGAAPQAPPDPLQLARAAYLAARERLVERLRMDWRDADTQANVELIQRRLRELDEIERQREQQKKEQEEQQKDEDKQKQEDPSKDQKPEDQKDPQKPDQPKEQDPGQDQEPKPDPQEEPAPEDGKDPKDEKAPEPKPMDPKDLPKMSKEEMLQLLERLEKIEEVQKDLQEKLKRMRRVSVEKDW